MCCDYLATSLATCAVSWTGQSCRMNERKTETGQEKFVMAFIPLTVGQARCPPSNHSTQSWTADINVEASDQIQTTSIIHYHGVNFKSLVLTTASNSEFCPQSVLLCFV
jgi:hypothetical protein